MDHANRVYQTRLQSEIEARTFQPAKGHLFASNLSDLLEERKAVKNAQELEYLAKQYEVDVSKLESLARYVTTPTVDPNSVKRILKDDGSEVTTMKVSTLGASSRLILNDCLGDVGRPSDQAINCEASWLRRAHTTTTQKAEVRAGTSVPHSCAVSPTPQSSSPGHAGRWVLGGSSRQTRGERSCTTRKSSIHLSGPIDT